MARFKVEFEGGEQGLDKIVDLAVSNAKGEFVLFANVMPQPVSWLEVILRPNEALEGGRPGYVLRAELLPSSGQEVLKVNPYDYLTGFRITKLQPVDSQACYGLAYPNSASSNSLEVFEGFVSKDRLDVPASIVCQKWNKATEGRLASEREVKDQARQDIQAFVKALALTVNSAYISNEEAVANQTLVLAVPT